MAFLQASWLDAVLFILIEAPEVEPATLVSPLARSEPTVASVTVKSAAVQPVLFVLDTDTATLAMVTLESLGLLIFRSIA